MRGKDPAWFRAPDKRALLNAAAESALKEDRLLLATLSDGDTIVSAGWGFAYGDEFLFHAFAYDARYSTYSPSRLFLECMVRQCIEKGIRTFDFMPGEEPYKDTWATDYIRTHSFIGPLNWRGVWLLKLARIRPEGSVVPESLKKIYRKLPVSIRRAARSRWRAFQSISDALRLKSRTEPVRPH
jgi:CelD/BcsL family acetyltransferase involved in cellulose biosynthesis